MVIRNADDHPFFQEWEVHKFSSKRSIDRADELLNLLKICNSSTFLTVGIVGSKGKGSTIAALSRILVSSGLKVGAITSPSYVDNRERIRFQNQRISESDYSGLSQKLKKCLVTLGDSNNGYLSPAGAFLSLGLYFFMEKKVDVVLIEEGMGGKGDEISLIDFDVLILTSVFLEHVGVLGNSKPEIAENLLDVISDNTKYLVAPKFEPEIEVIIQSKIEKHSLHRVLPDLKWPEQDLPVVLASNFDLAATAANRILEDFFGGLSMSLNHRINLPGRYMRIQNEFTGNREWFIDSANNPESLGILLNFLKGKGLRPSQIFVCFSNDSNQGQGLAALEGFRVFEVEIQNGRGKPKYFKGEPISLEEAFRLARSNEGLSLFIGSIWYVSNVLEFIQADLESW